MAGWRSAPCPPAGHTRGLQQQACLWSRLGLPRLPGANRTHLTTSIFLLKAEERIVSTIIRQRYIFQLYLELDNTVTLPAIASTPAPATMNLKSSHTTVGIALAAQPGPAPPALLCRELGAELGRVNTSAVMAPGLCPRVLPCPHNISPSILSSHHSSLSPAHLPEQHPSH